MSTIAQILLFCTLLLASAARALHASEDATPPDPAESKLDGWIKDLGSDNAAAQEYAHTQLQLTGVRARPKLLRALDRLYEANDATDPKSLAHAVRLYALLYDGPSDPDESCMVGTYSAAECRRLVSLSSILYVKDGQLQGTICLKNHRNLPIEVLELTLTIPIAGGGTQHSVFRLANSGLIVARPPQPGGRVQLIPVLMKAPRASPNEKCRVEITTLKYDGD